MSAAVTAVPRAGPSESGPGPAALLWLIVAMTLATLPFVASLPPWLSPVLAGIAIWRWRRERRGQPAPSRLTRVAVSGVVVAGLAASGSIGLGLEAAVPLFVSFLWIKLLELRGERDVLMGCYLCCFLASANLLTDQGVLRTAYALGALGATAAAALRFQLGRGGNAPEMRPLLRRAGILALQGLPPAVLLFLLLPRPVMTMPVDRGQAISGLSDRMRPGEIASIALSQEPAFRVTFPDGQPRDPEAMYWRGLTLIETDGGGWYRGHRPNRFLAQRPRPPRTAVGPPVEQEITLLPHMRHWLYALDCPTAWPTDVRAVSGLVLLREEVVQNPLTYVVRSRPDASPVEMDAAYRQRTLAPPPEVDPGVRALAATWRDRAEAAGDPGAAGIATAGLAWFTEQGFTYSLEPGVIEGDLVAGFLARRRGFCGHYSAAFTLLMRLAGVPARVVIGYRGGEWNEPGGFLVVRQAHAHAWSEIWLEDERRWQRIDPTAAVTGTDTRRIASEGAQAIDGDAAAGAWSRSLRDARQWWDWVNATWENWMFRFDAGAQERLRERLGIGGLGRLGATVVAVGAALTAVAALAFLLRRRRPRRDPARILYDRWCARLAAAGCVRAPDEGPHAFAARAAVALPTLAEEIAAVTGAYVAARYAPGGPDAIGRLRAAVRAAGGAPARG